MQQPDSTGRTILVAAVLCLVCSFVVSAAAVALRPIQAENETLDQQKNILDAAGLAIGEYGRTASSLKPEQIEELYGWVSERLVNLEDGSYDDEMDPESWDLLESISDPDLNVKIEGGDFTPGEESRPRTMKVFFVKRPDSDKIQQVVLPIYGKGLWGTLYGYLALKSDMETIQGITFYQHKETPGLGGEVDNPAWKAQWEGLKLYNEDGQPAAYVYKGPAPSDNVYAVDGLSGATITSRGVTNLVQYWASDDGYGPFLKKLKQEIQSDADSSAAVSSTPVPASDSSLVKG
ncbi:Na(+)-translocating NADH-quinone reductase subunit C [Rubripirellula amarantea]|uniref:Na(+)-translocating NADH-quinone reductase subunit C n=1 Tax=Rubripirellula amarantea TaxID=2527999 RepID=A0A5C5WEQ2_9BACT|nr:Na(+)-translocating NADH-quinone reductase subunit C [Rubripirellula amarantea]TWT49406.1 Na(+)-translocating NADH-quinone reductase subunit C [Rubripirellula amarantea]